jgi:hypothetical protein
MILLETRVSLKMSGKVKKKDIAGKFEHCESCDYTGSFHVFIERIATKGANNAKVRLKCPSCEQVYDVNLFCTIK